MYLRNISLCVFYIGLDKTPSSTETVPAPESEEKSKRSPFVLIDMV